MICGGVSFPREIRISISADKYLKYKCNRRSYFYVGVLAKHKLPILAPDLLTWWSDETSIR